jgi:hypothetical protein
MLIANTLLEGCDTVVICFKDHLTLTAVMSSVARIVTSVIAAVSAPMTKTYCTLESHIDMETDFTASLHSHRSILFLSYSFRLIVLVVVQWLASVTADQVVTDQCVDSGHQLSR